MHHLAQPTRSAGTTSSTGPAPALSQQPPPHPSVPSPPHPPPPLPSRSPHPPSASAQPTVRHTTSGQPPLASSSSASPAPRPLPRLPPAQSSSAMGQTQSRDEPVATAPASPVPPPVALPPTSAGPSSKLRRALAGRRKKSEDAASLLSAVQKFSGKGKDRDQLSIASSSTSELGVLRTDVIPPAVLTGHRKASQSSISASISPPPPQPPAPTPKPAPLQATKKPSLESATVADANARADSRISLMPLSPGMNPALAYIHGSEEQERLSHISEEAAEQEKEDRRKSDSTLATIVTARPGVAGGNRSSRPVSMAESVNSTKTVVPMSKRLSALVTDFDFAPQEESSSEDEDVFGPSTAHARPGRASPTASIKARNRRSQSLNLGNPPWLNKFKATSSQPQSAVADGAPLCPVSSRRTSSDILALAQTTSHDDAIVSKTAVPGIIGGTRGQGEGAMPSMPSSPRGNLRGRLAAWKSAATPSPSRSPPPPTHPSHSQLREVPYVRQPTISISGGLAPAAGFAMAMGKRGLEKVGRALHSRGGGGSIASNAASNASSTTLGSTHAPSSYREGEALGRVQSNSSGSGLSGWPANLAKVRGRHTPKAPSGSFSINSSAGSSSVSDLDGMSSGNGGVWMGRLLRPPLAPQGGMVFGRRLVDAVRDTTSVRTPESEGAAHRRMPSDLDFEILGPQVFEYRLVPAVVLRCAQHIVKWGLDEEGLFRINGRSTHTGKLKADFDTGADFNLMETMPSDLDPHAVSSVFKAYLRELPEPILTEELSAQFEAAMNIESANSTRNEQRLPRAGMRGPGLPSGPRVGPEMGIRKPPSLSTLAQPNFNGMPLPSKTLLEALSTLISRLPRENRDLLRTVTDLIKATAARSKVTKMPLSNLLLVFCPSLRMNPPLLRVLCEAEGVWTVSSKDASTPQPEHDESVVLDIKSTERASVLDIRPIPVPEQRTENMSRDVTSDASSAISNVSEAPSHTPPSLHGSTDDSASSLSASDVSATSSQSTPLDTVSFPMGAFSSAESLGPSTPAEEAPLSRPSVPSSELLKNIAPFNLHTSPVIASPSDNTPRPSGMAEAIEFPTFGNSPSTPLTKRRSTPFLSLPGLRSGETSPAPKSPSSPSSSGEPSPRALRLKRPSLTLLSFGKRSTSGSPLPSATYSISSPILTGSGSDNSNSALAASTVQPLWSPPPKISTSISSSPLSFDPPMPGSFTNPTIASMARDRLMVPPPAIESRSGSSSTSDSDGSFRSALEAPPSPRPRVNPSGRSRVTTFDPLRVSFHDGTEDIDEDWTRSVLLAASCSTDYTSSTSVQEAIRACESRGRQS